MIERVSVRTDGQGLFEITKRIRDIVEAAGVAEGICTIFVQHTSASLVIQENADPSARDDLERFLARLVPENDPLYTHTAEGADDMPAHIKSALTATSLAVPIQHSRLCLGTWQGIYLWEHRRRGGTRHLVVHVSQ
jgi:secondary thiamine-phosphate synthase enzyme